MTCNRAVTLETQLHVCHGSTLVLRGPRWLVTSKLAGDPLLGRPLLKALGLDCHKVLGVATTGRVLLSTSQHLSQRKLNHAQDGVAAYSTVYFMPMEVLLTQISTKKTTAGSILVPRTRWRKEKYSRIIFRNPKITAHL